MPFKLYATLLLFFVKADLSSQIFKPDSTTRVSSYEVILNSHECKGLGSIKINLFDTNNLIKFELISKTTSSKYVVQNETLLKNIPRGYYDLNTYDSLNEGDAIKNIHIGMHILPVGRFYCNPDTSKSYQYFNIINGVPPYSVQVKTQNIDSTLFLKDGIWDSALFINGIFPILSQYIFKDACGDSVSLVPMYNMNSVQLSTSVLCDSSLRISLEDSLFRFVSSFKYSWSVDSSFQIDSSVLITKFKKNPFQVKLKLSDTSGCYSDYTFDVNPADLQIRSHAIDLMVKKILSCNPDSNFILISDQNNTNTTFKWNTGENTNIINPKVTGIYTAVAANNTGCLDSISISIQISNMSISATKIDNVCFGKNTASINVTPQHGIEPYTFFWTDSAYSKDRILLPNGNYRLRITDSIGCKRDTSFAVKSPPPLNLNLFARAASCAPAKDGKVESMAFGGSPPYDVSWNNGLNVFNVDTLAVGFYKITVTDSNKCTTEFSFRIDDLSPLRGSKIDTLCAGGSISIGSKKYYNSGRYIDTLISRKGCDSIHVTHLVVNPVVDFSLTAIPPTCNGYTDGRLAVGTPIGLPSFTYYLNDRPVGLTGFENLSAGNYIVKLQDRFGCIKEKGISISNPEKIIFNIGNDTMIDYGDSLRVNAITNLDISKIKSIKWKTTPLETDCTSCGNLLAYRPKQDHTVIATLENLTGCKVEDEMYVKVNLDFKAFLPNAFSPSYSNYLENRRFTVLAGRQVIKVNYLRIFNRFGDQVYEAKDFNPNDPSIGWDGSFKGNDAPQGVYVYAAEVEYADGRIGRLKGDVTVLR